MRLLGMAIASADQHDVSWKNHINENRDEDIGGDGCGSKDDYSSDDDDNVCRDTKEAAENVSAIAQ